MEPSEVKAALVAQCALLLPGLLDARRERERVKSAEEKAIQAKLLVIGQCPMGFAWIKCAGGGWRCAGGSHHVSDEQLKREFGQEVSAK
jgi:hypothetical protein